MVDGCKMNKWTSRQIGLDYACPLSLRCMPGFFFSQVGAGIGIILTLDGKTRLVVSSFVPIFEKINFSGEPKWKYYGQVVHLAGKMWQNLIAFFGPEVQRDHYLVCRDAHVLDHVVLTFKTLPTRNFSYSEIIVFSH